MSVWLMSMFDGNLQTQNQDILSHQNVLSSFRERAVLTGNARANQRLVELTRCYEDVAERSTALVNQLKTDVAVHQNFHDNFGKCFDQLKSLRGKMAALSADAGDKFMAQTKLDTLRVTLKIIYLFICSHLLQKMSAVICNVVQQNIYMARLVYDHGGLTFSQASVYVECMYMTVLIEFSTVSLNVCLLTLF